MTCSSYWAHQVRSNITRKFPGALVLQARAYHTPRTIEHNGVRLEIPGVTPQEGDPIKQVRKLLEAHYDPHRADRVILMFHPRGGVSVLVLP